MPAPASIPEFLDLLRRSGVVDEDRIKAYLEQNKVEAGAPTRFAGQLVRDGLLTHFQAEQLLAGKWKRFSIGKYRVLERLGSGGMGQVFLCEHKLMRRRVAVKVLPSAKAEDPAALERFYREARAVAALDHPNLVRAFDIDQDDQLHFLVMEYVDGASLQEIIKKSGPMDPTRAAHYMHQAAVGLDYANQVAGLVHRDIKPGNILIDRTGVVKILDMGLARFFNDETDVLTRKYDESVLGTADYLSPEQAIDSHSVDIRADIYSLGATFYFVLAGQPPFPDGTVAQKLIWHQSKAPRPLADIRPGLPPELVRIVERMLRKDKSERYLTPAELADELVPLTSSPIPPPPDAEMPQLSLAAMVGVSNTPANPRAMAARLPGGYRTAAGGSSGALVRPPVSGFTPSSPLARPVSETISGGATDGGDTPANPFSVLMSGQAEPAASEHGILESVYAARPSMGPTGTDSPADRVGRRNWLMLGAAGILLAGAVALWWLNSRLPGSRTKSEPEPVASSGRILVVNPRGGADDFRTIKDAVRQARPGDRIQIRTPMILENLLLDGRSQPLADITIESGRSEGLPVVWAPPPNTSLTAHLLELNSCAGLTIRNIVFDGQGKIENAVRIAGHSPGLKLDQLLFRGNSKTGVRLSDASGESGRPVVVSGCRFHAIGSAEGAIRVTAADPVSGSREIDFVGNQFDGPFVAAIFGEGPAGKLRIEQNRIFRATDGIRWRNLTAGQSLTVQIRGNTMYDVKSAAVRFDPMASSDKSQVTLADNLIVKSGVVLSIPEGEIAKSVTAVGNIRDPATKDGDLPQPTRQESRVDFNSIDPAARDFLRYSRSSRLATASADGGPVGAPPLE
ncbi:MAG: protein kinase [Gemmataceae bacterium]|nr:protein kinase [Gemmataceae bacterium]